MFNFLKKKTTGEKISFKIDGMHCTSCSMNIDDTLEEIEGVQSSNTSYAKATTTVVYDPALVDKAKLKSAIEELEYKVE